eukprot:1158330-Pelagomonas_calceolata.AAC.6
MLQTWGRSKCARETSTRKKNWHHAGGTPSVADCGKRCCECEGACVHISGGLTATIQIGSQAGSFKETCSCGPGSKCILAKALETNLTGTAWAR